MEGGDSIPGAESLCWENVRVKVTLGEIVKGVKVKANKISGYFRGLFSLPRALPSIIGWKKNHLSFHLTVSH